MITIIVLFLLLLSLIIALHSLLKSKIRLSFISGTIFLLLSIPISFFVGEWTGSTTSAFCMEGVVFTLREITDQIQDLSSLKELFDSIETADYATECHMISDALEKFEN